MVIRPIHPGCAPASDICCHGNCQQGRTCPRVDACNHRELNAALVRRVLLMVALAANLALLAWVISL